jgi:hypothetical protein
MKPSRVRKIVDATLLLVPILGALIASAAVRAAEPGPKVTLMTMDDKASEAGHEATLVAVREGAAVTQPLVVPIKLGGTATPGADYASPGPTITFPAQTPMVMVKITPLRDALLEGTETVTVTLLPGSTYTLGEEKSGTVTITDASGSAASTGGSVGKGTQSPTGTLTVEITLDGQGNWKSPHKDGAYSAMNFHRTMKYTVPLQGFVGGGSGFTDIDKRDQKAQTMLPNLYRYVVMQPQAAMTGQVGAPCGKGEALIQDEYKGMEVGDPGQPPLVPYTETWREIHRPFPSGDKTVPERDLCLTRFALDTEKHVVHIAIDGSDSHVKTQITHNAFKAVPINVRFQGDDLESPAKAKLTFFDVPVAAGAKSFEFTRPIENFSQVTGKGNTRIPLRATVKWRVTMQ